MYPRRHLLPLLSALALLLAPFALAPQASQAQGNQYIVDTLLDNDGAGCTNPADDDDCSLRQALLRANADIGASDITFDASLIGGVITLADLNNPLPALSANGTTISGAAGDASGTPNIAIDGNGSIFNGITVTGNSNVISSLSVYGFVCSTQGAGGIVVQSGSGNRIERNYIGLTLAGAVPTTRNCNGVVIRGGATGTRVQNFNVISANTFDGVLVQNASDSVVIGNRIGLSPDAGQSVLGNQQNGVHVFASAGETTARTTIGSATINTDRNVIGGNGTGLNFAGIRIAGSGTITTTVAGNVVGLNSAGNAARGNTGDGIFVGSGARATSLSGTTASALVVSGNNANGIRVTGSTTQNTTLSGVFVGTTGAGNAAIANAGDGVKIDSGATSTTLTGGASVNRTIIAGNAGRGVFVDGTSTATTRVENSLIGVVIAGTTSAVQANAQGGVLVQNARTTTLSGNTISGNTLFGVRLTGALTTTLTGNFVGLSLNRKAVQGNAGPGVEVLTSRNTLIGGVSSAVNFIAGNVGPAIALSGTQATNTFSTTVRGNQIGLIQQAASSNYLERGPNSGEGVRVSGTVRQLTLDGNTVAAAADTTATDFPAILVQGDGSSAPVTGGLSATNVATVTITGNRIGWMPAAIGSSTLLAFSNADGVVVSGRAQNINILTNTIRLNVGAAVRLSDVLTVTVRANNPVTRNIGGGIIAGGASRNLILSSNVISDSGRSPAGVVVNAAANGIFLDGAATLTGAQILSNTLRANTGRGIALQGDVNRATMRFNKLAQNGGAIKLVGSTVYPGSGADPDTQVTPNHGIDGPIVDLNFVNPLSLRINQSGVIEGYVYTSTLRTESGLTPASACITCTIQVFRPETLTSAEEQGWLPLTTLPESGGSTPRDLITVAANGRFVARLLSPLPKRLLFIATDGFGNSSEFTTLPLTASLLLEPISALATSAAPGETVTYTLRLRNNGTVGYSNLRLATGGTLARWGLTTVPITSTDFAVAAGASRLVTVTLKLPTGSDPNVAFGKKDTTTITITGSPPPVTVTARLETTVLARPVISVTPRSSLGAGKPQTAVPHAFTIKNDGNVTVTLNIAYRTVDPANSPGVWSTSINSTTLTLGPGKDARLGLSVTVPAGALQNVSATTFLTATLPASVTPPYPAQTIVFSATTRADLNANADIFPEVEAQGVAEGQVILTHNVRNQSNGTAKFCLDYFTAGQSRVRFESATNGFVVDSQGCFTLYAGVDVNAALGRYSLAQFRAIVTIDRRLTTGNIETVTIFLRRGSPTGETISDALVEDRILITGGIKVPRLWLPLMRNAGTQ